MIHNHIIFIAALIIFAASAVRLVFQRALFSPQFVACIALLVMGLMVIFPQMIFSHDRQYIMAIRTQVFVLIAAVTFLVTACMVKRPVLRSDYPPVHWRIMPRRFWLFGLLCICMADPMVSYLLHGKVGIVQGNESMGQGGGDHSDVFTPLTFIAWSASSVSMAIVTTDFLFSFKSIPTYLRSRILDVLIVIGCSLCTALSGNRFVLFSQVLSLMLGLALFSRLRFWMLGIGALLLTVYFVVAGNYRFGTVDVTKKVQKSTGNESVDMVYAWAADYTEPTFPNLDNFIHDQPGMLFGMAWVSSVLPSELVDALGINRNNAAIWLSDNSLYAYHGLTFRTMYPDLIMDFGFKGALVMGAVFFWAGARIYNQSLKSPFHFLLFLAYAPLILLMPLTAPFYSLPNLLVFGVVFIIRKPRTRPSRSSLLERSRDVARQESIPAPILLKS